MQKENRSNTDATQLWFSFLRRLICTALVFCIFIGINFLIKGA